MSKFGPNDTLDAMLDEIATCNIIHVTSDSATPSNLTNSLAATALTPGDGGGDFTIADGASGRKVSITAQSGVDISSSGTANHIVLALNATIKYVTTCTAQALTSGGTVDIPTWDIQISDPT